MSKGVLLFAHNNREVDYGLLALISAGLAKKHLSVPASLVADSATLDWAKQSDTYSRMQDVFENIIEVERPVTMNMRNLHDGATNKSVSFTNTNRSSALDLTPYDRTLLLDSDYLIFTNRLGQFWDVEESVLIGHSMLDVYDQKRMGFHDKFISDTGPHLYWATTVMFSKDPYSKLFFELVDYVKNNYQYYADLFRFDARQFRNDIAFSVAKHILDGFEDTKSYNLPPILTIQDRDILHDVSTNRLTFLVTPDLVSNYCLASVKDIDIHVMNKQSIVRNKEKLLALI
jgi:hypothetical protein